MGSVLTLELQGLPSVSPAACMVRVRWVGESTDGKWNIGCAFHRPLTQQELETFVECTTGTVTLRVEKPR